MPKLTLSFKGRVMDVFHLESGITHIGRNADCTIVIDSLAIAPLHITLSAADDDYLLEARDEEYPVLVNHEKAEQVELHHGDVIQIGKHTLTYAEDVMDLGTDLRSNPFAKEERQGSEENNQNEGAQPTSGILQIVSGDNFGRIIPLKRHMTRIGYTGGDCAMITRREDGYFISLLEGPNPPSINHKSIGDMPQLLKDGDLVEVGDTQMQFHL
jgi:pSer/pThr/pTyr-binding forkhead associated (FHA) protein